mmetsp:Transcript_49694/g.75029  ORF Transcript_49694/g.75029 Transcript_49694/m.75029 type:complete len:427 (+) Transcript_49694:1606-2886(+)
MRSHHHQLVNFHHGTFFNRVMLENLTKRGTFSSSDNGNSLGVIMRKHTGMDERLVIPSVTVESGLLHAIKEDNLVRRKELRVLGLVGTIVGETAFVISGSEFSGIDQVVNINALEGSLYGSDLFLEVVGIVSQDIFSEIGAGKSVRVAVFHLGAESSELVGPEHAWLAHFLAFEERRARNGKEAFDDGKNGQEGRSAASEEIEGDDSFCGPGVEADVGLEQHADTGDAGGDQGVAVVREQGQPGVGDDVHHGLGEELFRVEEGAVHVFHVHQQMLSSREVLFLIIVVIIVVVIVIVIFIVIIIFLIVVFVFHFSRVLATRAGATVSVTSNLFIRLTFAVDSSTRLLHKNAAASRSSGSIKVLTRVNRARHLLPIHHLRQRQIPSALSCAKVVIRAVPHGTFQVRPQQSSSWSFQQQNSYGSSYREG